MFCNISIYTGNISPTLSDIVRALFTFTIASLIHRLLHFSQMDVQAKKMCVVLNSKSMQCCRLTPGWMLFPWTLTETGSQRSRLSVTVWVGCVTEAEEGVDAESWCRSEGASSGVFLAPQLPTGSPAWRKYEHINTDTSLETSDDELTRNHVLSRK